MQDVKKILTEYPFVDELVYYTKLLAINAVIKNEALANSFETLECQINANMFIACVEGKAKFTTFNHIPESVLIESGIPASIKQACLIDKFNIPETKRDLVTSKMIVYTQNNYVEMNTYYRRLMGLPPLNDKGIKIPDELIDDELDVDWTRPVHEMDTREINIIESYGILEQLKELYPDLLYLNYLGDNAISPYVARKAANFQILYIPNIDSREVLEKFKTKYEDNRIYAMRTIYSEAFKYGSDHYDEFIIILILIMTMVDIISEVQEFILRREIFDNRSIQYLFQSNGIPYWADIPTKYQIAMIKNMHTLLKYKSSTKNLIDICSLFGFNDVSIFRYYILRDRRVTPDGEYVFEYKKDENGDYLLDSKGNKIPDNMENYELKFIKVPITDKADKYIKDAINHVEYDTITLADPYWDGEGDHNEIKEAIINQELTVARTKYIGVDTTYDLTRMSFDLPYFYNMIYYMSNKDYAAGRRRFNLEMTIPSLRVNHQFKLTDVFSYLFCLGYLYMGLEDKLMDTPTKVLSIEGFNFEADLNELKSYCLSKGYTLETLLNTKKLGTFKQPLECLSYEQLAEVFITNRAIYDHIVEQIFKADDKYIYDIYKHIHDALMITDLNTNFFRMDNGQPATTWTEYIQSRDAVLYSSIMKFKEMSDPQTRQTAIVNNIIEVIGTLDEWLDSDAYAYIYSTLPGSSADYVQLYMQKVINFFKSYKTHLLEINTVYKFYNKLENTIRAIDCIGELTDIYTVDSKLKYGDMIFSLKSNRNEIEKMKLDEQIWVKSWRWVLYQYPEIFEVIESISGLKVVLHWNDAYNVGDNHNIRKIWFNRADYINISSFPTVTSELSASDIASFKKDDCYIVETYE